MGVKLADVTGNIGDIGQIMGILGKMPVIYIYISSYIISSGLVFDGKSLMGHQL